MRLRILALVGLFSTALMCLSAEAQQPAVAEDPAGEITELRNRMLRTNEENLELMRSLSYSQVTRLSGSICLNDINNAQEHITGKLETIIALVRALSQQDGSTLGSYLKGYTRLVMEDLPLDRKKVNLSAGICGSVPLIVNRAQIALAFLNDVERTLSRLNQRYLVGTQ